MNPSWSDVTRFRLGLNINEPLHRIDLLHRLIPTNAWAEKLSYLLWCNTSRNLWDFHRQLMFILEAKLCGDIFIRHHEMFSMGFPIVFLPNEIRSHFSSHYMCGEVGPRLQPQWLLQTLPSVFESGLTFLSCIRNKKSHVSWFLSFHPKRFLRNSVVFVRQIDTPIFLYFRVIMTT